MKRGFEVYFDSIIKISKYNLQSASGGCIGGTHKKLREKSSSCCKIDLKTLDWVMESSTDPVPNNCLGRIICIIEIGDRWRSFILAWKRMQNGSKPVSYWFQALWKTNVMLKHSSCTIEVCLTDETTSDSKMFKMSRCLLILSVEGTTTRVSIQMAVDAVL